MTRIAFAVVACAVMAPVLVMAADAPPAPDAAAIAAQATERAKNFQLDIKPVQPSQAQRQQAEAVAEGARNNARAELAKLAAEHPFTPAPDVPAVSSDNPAVAAENTEHMAGRVVIALSTSMPISELREYFAQLDGKPEALVVFRGFAGGAKTVTPMIKQLEEVTRVNPADLQGRHRHVNIVVDPLLYRNLKIDRVPAVAWLPGVSDVSHCDGATFDAAVTVYGTTAVSYALKTINKNGGDVPAALIKKFGG